MAVEKFLQRLRSSDKPHGNRSRNTGPIVDLSYVDEPVGFRQMLPALARQEKAPRIKVLPMYPANPLARKVSLWLGRRGPGKAAKHPMRGFRSPKAAHRNAA